ncbi:NCS2 family permease [Naumannella cuiyingiana]|uniref:AGZA family xanthine/uracil permease-like MFS transporter n=1 Tax=Naumannella cuiyingiana TaxID=1347891 RepID=A0A7Z0D9X0_9ACTN|nr:NCS2 family permease [Naumannella cuiyingiana]NYI71665.1 AGZA family xanthine/uracil permease-like MFS transporter [Naumannella cuiyingiana]
MASSTPTQSGLDRWFELSKRGSTMAREVRGGLVTFFTMAYIVALNPLIIGTAPDINDNLISGLPNTPENVAPTIGMVAAATALIAAICTIAMGAIARYPVALATGLGLNALLAYVIAPQMTWPQAMGLVLIEGVLIGVLALTGFRTAVFRAVPRSLRAGIAVGIGLFLTLVGLVESGIVTKIPGDGTVPVQLGLNGSLTGWPMAVFVLGLVLVSVLYARKVPGAMLIAIILATIAAVIIQAVAPAGSKPDDPTGWSLNVPSIEQLVAAPDLSLLGRVDPVGAFTSGSLPVLAVALLIFTLMLADFFDTMGTIVAVGAEGDLLDAEGNPPHLRSILLVDSGAAALGGLGSVSSNTSYIESATGVAEGARTGIASIVTGLAFAVAIVLSPVINVVPSEAATPVLVFVGFLMLQQVTEIDWSKVEDGLPAFLTLALMPFTYSITTGIGAGFIFWVLLRVVLGRAREVHPIMWVVAAAFVVYFLQGPIGALIG